MTQTLPITFAQKEMRIQKMPTNLRALQPDRTLPPMTINQIQLGLNEIMSQTKPTPRNAPGLTNYNLEMRNIVHNTSLSAANATTLNRMFSSILVAVDTPNPGLTNVVSGVNQLVSQVDTASINPVFLATNDNAYILQLALVLGQQMPAPRAPTITKGTGHQAEAWYRDHAPVRSDVCRQLRIRHDHRHGKRQAPAQIIGTAIVGEERPVRAAHHDAAGRRQVPPGGPGRR